MTKTDTSWLHDLLIILSVVAMPLVIGQEEVGAEFCPQVLKDEMKHAALDPNKMEKISCFKEMIQCQQRLFGIDMLSRLKKCARNHMDLKIETIEDVHRALIEIVKSPRKNALKLQTFPCCCVLVLLKRGISYEQQIVTRNSCYNQLRCDSGSPGNRIPEPVRRNFSNDNSPRGEALNFELGKDTSQKTGLSIRDNDDDDKRVKTPLKNEEQQHESEKLSR